MRNKLPSIYQTARKMAVHTDPRSVVAEQYRSIRTNINFARTEAKIKTILVTSALKEEGKSTTACNMAIAFTEEGKKVLLVDADMRRPTVHFTFLQNGKVGLSSLFMGTATISEAISETRIAGLDVLPCGPLPSNPAELLGSSRMDQLIEELKKQYDVVLFDSPPLLSVTDSRILANKCDGTILVVRAGISEQVTTARARDSLHSSKGNLLGVVLNNYRLSKDRVYGH
ncbi:CpsD/CapB family tyrosine-protein kinase [Planococcus lenghuensis]|uniref:non-specific protein-tyrosine kinase n=1 Tax=Planococcus lenghuensis TaxID=2213202 RepID=A0A1Q2L2X0_9BACL|nr:CpsD/CapB family tyrosine-protein kinase [Planococcus lenghuensis]AQQ54232.1 capsular biosynthesis protein [Planococcus lenghuensis]